MARKGACPAPSMATPEQIDALDERARAQAAEDARYGVLYDGLLSIGGVGVVPSEEPDLDKLLERGYLRDARGVRMKKGRPVQCHGNAARIWEMNRNWAVIVTGWALTADGLWRQHSWVKDRRDDRLFETTTKRELYFGFDLEPAEAVIFYLNNRH